MSDHDLKAPPRSLVPQQDAVLSFTRSIDRLVPDHDQTLGLAVSGGPDSIALLLLAAAAREGKVEAATVDHQLREGSHEEAQMVASLCEELGVPHRILTLEWKEKPQRAIQERARIRRYAALADWAKERSIKVLATAHHADDQVETLIMRLNRGSGVKGLAGMRSAVTVPGSDKSLIRPLLGWRRKALREICKYCYVDPVEDPSNEDERFERSRVRAGLAKVGWVDIDKMAMAAAHLNEADVALKYYAGQAWKERVRIDDAGVFFKSAGLPIEIRRRIAERIIARLATEGRNVPVKGLEMNRVLSALNKGNVVTLRGVRCGGGDEWSFAKAPPRAKPGPGTGARGKTAKPAA